MYNFVGNRIASYNVTVRVIPHIYIGRKKYYKNKVTGKGIPRDAEWDRVSRPVGLFHFFFLLLLIQLVLLLKLTSVKMSCTYFISVTCVRLKVFLLVRRVPRPASLRPFQSGLRTFLWQIRQWRPWFRTHPRLEARSIPTGRRPTAIFRSGYPSGQGRCGVSVYHHFPLRSRFQ